jgi:choline kinase
MKGVILAVGLGQPVEQRVSHGLRSVIWDLERPVLDTTIEAFAQAGFEEVGIVLSRNQGILQRYLEDSSRYGIAVYCMNNVQYLRGRGTSVYASRAFVGGEPFVVATCDRRFDASSLQSLLGFSWGINGLCVSEQAHPHRKATGEIRVWMDGSRRVCRVGDSLRHWNALCTGTFLFQPDVFRHISDVLQFNDGSCTLAALLRRLIEADQAPYACAVNPLSQPEYAYRRLDVRPQRPFLSVRFAQDHLAA